MLEKDYDLCYEKDDKCYDAEELEKCQMIQEKGPRMLLTLIRPRVRMIVCIIFCDWTKLKYLRNSKAKISTKMCWALQPAYKGKLDGRYWTQIHCTRNP